MTYRPPQGGLDRALDSQGYDRAIIYANAQLLIEDRLVIGNVLETQSGIMDVQVTRLTSAGHDDIASIRSDTWWEKSKKIVKEKGASLTLAAIVQVAKSEAIKLLGS